MHCSGILLIFPFARNGNFLRFYIIDLNIINNIYSKIVILQ